jgi:NAD dependent epimerase/dehydratase family enzyme
MLLFKIFAGGPVGNCKQGLPWIHLADEEAGILFLLENEKAHGIY